MNWIKTHFVFEFYNDWAQLFGKWNWISYTLFTIDFENDRMTHGYEFRFILLGLGVMVRYNTDEALKLFEKWKNEAKEAI